LDFNFYLSTTFFIIAVFLANYKTKHIYSALFSAFCIFLYLSMTIMYFVADYFTGKGITQAVIFTFESGLNGAGFGEYITLIVTTLFFVFCIIFLTYIYFLNIKDKYHIKTNRTKQFMHILLFLLSFLIHPFNIDIYNIYISTQQKQSTDFNQFYTKADFSLKQIKDYNLVYIYAESLEKTYFDESLFPGLMKNLQALKKRSTEFNDINQVSGTGWTIGGMTATQCGIPLFTTSYGNSMNGTSDFLSGATCLGDILKSKGYHLTFMQGSSIDFSGIRNLYKTHKFDEVFGFEKLSKLTTHKEYFNGWGLYDDSLFPLVYKKFDELSKTNKPFALFMATMDTHHPYGMTSKSCKDMPYDTGGNSILNAVHCSDQLISDFIKQIQNGNYKRKTLVVLTSDHLAMRNTASDLLKKKKRKNLFLIFDPFQKQYISIEKPASMLDVGSTVLHALGIKSNFGLGRNLLQEKSLYSMFKDFNKKLSSWREEILNFWQFAMLGRHYSIDIIQQKTTIGLRSYKIPMIAKIGEDETIKPIFEFNSPKSLTEYFLKFKPKEKFIWIDKCNKINYLLNHDKSSEYCVTQGSLSTINIEVEALSNKKTNTIYTKDFLQNHKNDTTIYTTRIGKIEELFSCRKPLPNMDSIAVLSSRLPTFVKVPSAIATPSQFIPISQKLNVLSRDDTGTYSLQEFDVYGNKLASFKFLKTIKTLIDEKKFWVIVAQHKVMKHPIKGYTRDLEKLGFKLLPSLDKNASYIGYVNENGELHEYSDTESKCKIISTFIR